MKSGAAPPAAGEAHGSLAIAGAVGFYFLTSISLVLLNKMIFSDSGLDAPLFLTWTQIVVAVLWCVIAANAKPFVKGALDFFPPLEYDFATAVRVLPLSVVFVGMIAFNNLCLKYVEVSFYQVARSLTIVFNMLGSYIILGQPTSKRAVGACAVVITGYVLGAKGEIHFSTIGVIFGVLSSVFVAAYSIYIKRILPLVGNDQWRLMLYNNINTLLILPFFIILAGEPPAISGARELLSKVGYQLMLFFVGTCGFLINIATVMQIKYTSPLTHNVSGTAKACVQSILGVLIWQNPISAVGAFGTFVCIGGCFLYGYVRYLEMQLKEGKLREAVPLEGIKTSGGGGGGGGDAGEEEDDEDMVLDTGGDAAEDALVRTKK